MLIILIDLLHKYILRDDFLVKGNRKYCDGVD